jgi:hypothetical protein
MSSGLGDEGHTLFAGEGTSLDRGNPPIRAEEDRKRKPHPSFCILQEAGRKIAPSLFLPPPLKKRNWEEFRETLSELGECLKGKTRQ